VWSIGRFFHWQNSRALYSGVSSFRCEETQDEKVDRVQRKNSGSRSSDVSWDVDLEITVKTLICGHIT
jgi:hypothetical protein